MGPISIIRERGFAMDARRWLFVIERMARARTQVAELAHAIASSLSMLVGSQARHVAFEASATVCVVGGVLAAPLLTILAFVGLALPGHAPLHHVASTLLLVAVLWLSVALVGAHMHHGHAHHRKASE